MKTDRGAGTFMNIVAANYDDIKRLYAARENDHGRRFNEDSFNDAFIKCSTHFGNDIIDYDTVIKYFWIAYINTTKNKKNNKIELCEEYPETLDDDEKSFAQKFYDNIMDVITEKFGEEDMLIYSLHKYHKWSKQDLINAGYNIENLEIKIKNIHKFVKEYAKKQYKLKSLI